MQVKLKMYSALRLPETHHHITQSDFPPRQVADASVNKLYK